MAFKRLQQMDPALREKLRSARRYGDTKVVSGAEAVFTSDRDLEELAMDEFDAKLRDK